MAKGFKDFEWMRKDPDLESIHGDPRFKALEGSQNGSRGGMGWMALCALQQGAGGKIQSHSSVMGHGF